MCKKGKIKRNKTNNSVTVFSERLALEPSYANEISLEKNAPGGVWTRDLRITLAPLVVIASIAYKYDALTDCATGAGRKAGDLFGGFIKMVGKFVVVISYRIRHHFQA